MYNKCCKNNISEILLITIILIAIIITTIFIICCNNTEQKNILTAIAVRGDNTQTGTTTIKFSRNDIQEGTAISHTTGSDEVNINETGIYQISYQLNGEQNSGNIFNFNAVLLVNNVSIDDTFNEGVVIRDTVNNRMTLTSTVILRLNAGDILKLQGVSLEDITYSRARIDIEKIG